MPNLICVHCKREYMRYVSKKRISKINNTFCSNKCRYEWQKNKPEEFRELTCANCNNKFLRNKKSLWKSNNDFCCMSCSATFNNKKFPKNSPARKYYCKVCKSLLDTHRRYCNNCNPYNVDWSKITLGDAIYTADKQHSNRYTKIRENAKSVFNSSNKPKTCVNCSYDKHYHICHIKPINSFDLSTPISVINGIDNLIALCPNCHWELDNGLLKL